MNHYSLRHPSTIAKIDAGMKESIRMALKNNSGLGWSLVQNSKGETLMHVRYSRLHSLSDLRFFDKHLQDISNTVKAALRSTQN